MTHPPAAHRVARHTTLSLLGFIVPLAIAVVAIPIAARALGPARFGMLGLAWATMEYFSFFDVGLSRATVRFVAHALALASRDLRQIVSVSLSTQFAGGIVAGLIVWALTPVAVELFSLEGELRGEALAMFRVVGANIAIVLMMNGLRGVLEGAQRFDLAVALRIPSAAATTAVPAVGAAVGATLPEILWMVFAVRIIIVAALIAVIPAAIRGFRWEIPREWNHLRRLLGYSGWLAVSGIASAVLVNLDRFALAAMVGIAAVGFYTAAFEGAMRLLLIPHSMFAALFPALAVSETLKNRVRTTELLESALRQMALLLSLIVVFLIVFAPEILRLWVGEGFAEQSSLALRILALGVFANSLGFIAIVFLYATGRPDLPAKLHLAEVAVHIPLTLLLVRYFGVSGAAAAWTLRVIVDAVVLSAIVRRLKGWRVGPAERRLWLGAAGSLGTFIALVLAVKLADGAAVSFRLIAVGMAAAAAVYIAWTRAVAPHEHTAWLRMLRRTTAVPDQ